MYIAYYQDMTTHYVTDSQADAWAFVDDQDNPSDYAVYRVSENELVNW